MLGRNRLILLINKKNSNNNCRVKWYIYIYINDEHVDFDPELKTYKRKYYYSTFVLFNIIMYARYGGDTNE